MRIMDRLRRTGRTHRMLTEAYYQAKFKNKTCQVIAAHSQHSQNMFDTFRVEFVEEGSYNVVRLSKRQIEFLGGGSVQFKTVDRLHDLIYITNHENLKTFIDHYTIEVGFAHIIEELHRWDRGISDDYYGVPRPANSSKRLESSESERYS